LGSPDAALAHAALDGDRSFMADEAAGAEDAALDDVGKGDRAQIKIDLIAQLFPGVVPVGSGLP
jgi:hypothetical protein